MRIWISGGGTAGHVYPGLTVRDTLVVEQASEMEIDVRWLGRKGGLEEALVLRAGLPFHGIDAAPMVGVGALGRLRNLVTLAKGLWAAWRLAGTQRPAAVLVTGGYVCVPVAIAARLRRVPIMIYLPDIIPGKAVRFIARLADVVAVTHEAALGHFRPGQAFVSGYPIRADLRDIQMVDPSKARDRVSSEAGDAASRLRILVFGGSQGARRLNRSVAQATPQLLELADVIHISGPTDHADAWAARERLPESLKSRYVLHEYLHSGDMAAALATADLAVCRAGASSLGELPAMSLPAILVPLPISGGHQWPNARMLESEGAAIVVDDAEMNGQRLLDAVGRLLGEPQALAAMKENASRLDRPNAASEIGRRLLVLAGAAA